jgi:uncharacterized metal-binding protein
MASGKVHDWVTLAAMPALFFLNFQYFHWPWPACTMAALGIWIGGSLLSPDLDTRSRPYYRWGIFRFIWWPYQWTIRHRSSASHGLLFAPVFRLLYLSAVLILFYTGFYSLLAHYSGLSASLQKPRLEILEFIRTHLHELIWLGVGVWIGGLLHTALDFLSSALIGKGRKR